MKQRPILKPPIQVSHGYYRLSRVLVWAGISRYYNITGLDAFDRLPTAGTPTIFIGNHQNGLMDPMPICAFVPQQVHWLTRADVFWNRVARHIIMATTNSRCIANAIVWISCVKEMTSFLTFVWIG